MKLLDSTPFKLAIIAASITTIGIAAFALTAPSPSAPDEIRCIEQRPTPPPAPPPIDIQPEPPRPA